MKRRPRPRPAAPPGLATERLYVGVDLGTAAIKAAAIDGRTGALRAQAQRRLAVRAAADGTREQDPQAILRALRRIVSELRAELGDGAWRRVAGIGLAAQGGSAVIVDSDTGRPHTPMYLWNDTRATAHRAKALAGRPVSFWNRIWACDVAGAGLGRILWLRERDARLLRDGRMYVGAGEFAYFHLTGTWRQDACTALQLGGYDVRARRISAAALAAVGVAAAQVAPLRDGHQTHPLRESAAGWSGLAENTPVAGPYHDQEAAYAAVASASGSPLQCSLGTAWVANFVVPADLRTDAPRQLLLPGPTHSERLVVLPILTGSATWDWALAVLVSRNPGTAYRGADRIFAESLMAPRGLLCVPWSGLENPFVRGASGAAAFLGAGSHTSRADLLRALAACMVFEMRRVCDDLVKRGIVDTVVLGGGMGKANAIRELFAGAFAPLPVHAVETETFAGARGCLVRFGKRPSRAPTRTVKRLPETLRRELDLRYRDYLKMIDRFAADVPQSGPYRIRGSASCR